MWSGGRTRQAVSRLHNSGAGPFRNRAWLPRNQFACSGRPNWASLGDCFPWRGSVDHHALWIDPSETDHLILGNDGGLYHSFDGGATWNFQGNLSQTQFYQVDVDNGPAFLPR